MPTEIRFWQRIGSLGSLVRRSEASGRNESSSKRWPWGWCSSRISSLAELNEANSKITGLPVPLPTWPLGTGFATGKIYLGELVVAQIFFLEAVWSSFQGGANNTGAAVYKPVNLPPGFYPLGYHCQSVGEPVGSVLVVAPAGLVDIKNSSGLASGELKPGSVIAYPVDYTLVWTSKSWKGKQSGAAYFWIPVAPGGYKVLGYVVTTSEVRPKMEEIVCVRSDLTQETFAGSTLWSTNSNGNPFAIWSTDASDSAQGVTGSGVNVGTFYSDSSLNANASLPGTCLKNVDLNLSSMPTSEQARALMESYGPTVFFHPDEEYVPSSVEWFFRSGALLYTKGSSAPPERILEGGSNLPAGGSNDGEYWIDLPDDGTAGQVKKGDIDSAITYVHVKPMAGGTVTEMQCWIYYPFNGPSTVKIGLLTIPLDKVGQHVSDWEHFTLRIGNFDGDLQQVYFGQHSRGVWVKPDQLEFLSGNHPVVYSARHSHATYPHPGTNLQGDANLSVGIRNDTARSNLTLDTSRRYQFVSAEYLSTLGKLDSNMEEPPWLQFMRQWGPTIEYDSKSDLDKLLSAFPAKVRKSVEDLLEKLPDELGGEEGPTGPKEKDFWNGPER